MNYRVINWVIVPNKYLILHVDKLFDKLWGASIFSKSNLKLGCHQILMKEMDISKILFHTNQEHYEFQMMLFDLSKHFSIFDEPNISNLLQKFMVVFFMISLYSAKIIRHHDHLLKVIDILK